MKLTIWDTAGQERFHALAPIYYRNANGAILVYDITDKNSFEKIRNWVNELYKMCDNITIFIAANKSDLKNKIKVDINDAKLYANNVNANIIETSAKNGKGINELMYMISKKLIDKSKYQSKSKKPKITFDYDSSFDNNSNNNNNSCACNII